MCGMKKGTEKGKELFSRGKKTEVVPILQDSFVGFYKVKEAAGTTCGLA